MNIPWEAIIGFLIWVGGSTYHFVTWMSKIDNKLNSMSGFEKMKQDLVERPTYKYLDDWFARKDMQAINYSHLIEKINGLEKKIDNFIERERK
jgi:hypothetical protein